MDTRMHADAIPDADRAALADPAARRGGDRGVAAGRAGPRARRARRDPQRPGSAETVAMKPRPTYPAQRDDVRLLVIDPLAPADAGLREDAHPCPPRLPDRVDLLVVNDAATCARVAARAR
jgi:hypothetical protein